MEENDLGQKTGTELERVKKETAKRRWSWLWGHLPLIIAVAVAAMAIGLAVGWIIHNPGTPLPGKLMSFDLCGQTAEAKAARNLAWKQMNDENIPASREKTVSILVQTMVTKGVPWELRVEALKKYFLKASLGMDQAKTDRWGEVYLKGTDAQRLEAIQSLVDDDAYMANLAACLLKDKGRMAKIVAGQKVPLEQ